MIIAWSRLLGNVLCILGLSVLLAALSVAHWTAGLTHTTFRQVLSQAPFRLAIVLGALLFISGMMLTDTAWWLKISWVAVMALAAWEGIAAGRDWRGRAKRS